MKNIFLLIVFAFLFAFGCNVKKIEPEKLVLRVVDQYKKHNSISYNIDYGIKHFDNEDDTTKITAGIDLVRVLEDSIFGGLVWINYDSTDLYYDMQKIYAIFHREKIIIRYKKEQSFGINSKTIGAAIRIYFLNPDRLISMVNDTTNIVKVKEDKFNNSNILEVDFPKDEYVENGRKKIWINKKNNSISKIDFSIDMQGENQYNYWKLSNIVYDKISINDLEKRFLKFKNNYKIKDFKLPDKKEMEPLAVNSNFPGFEGSEYKTGQKIMFQDYKGKVTLLDFWYIDCFPCIKAISYVNNLYKKYNKKGLAVLGVNPINNNEKDLQRFPKFLDKNKIDYPIVFIDKEKTSELKLRGYPTIYLIDKSGKIIYSKLGFEEKEMKKIENLIKENL